MFCLRCFGRYSALAATSFGKLPTFATRNVNVTTRGPAIKVSESIASNLECGDPVVALESAIITHGMPFPDNLECALKVQQIIKDAGAHPATIGIIKGEPIVGLSKEQLERLSRSHEPVKKVSRRDLSCVITHGLNGGCTVSATCVLASRVGINVFVTGGIGGVHRGAPSSWDVSSDLTELGRTDICVVAAGVKSILDIGKTLEYLETQGVCVITLGEENAFPAFFTRDSGFKAPHQVLSCQEAARVVANHQNLGLNSGILIAVPIPEQFQAHGERVESAIRTAIADAEQDGVTGADLTPRLLARVSQLTSGDSTITNKYLIENNALRGAEIAVHLSELRKREKIDIIDHQRQDAPSRDEEKSPLTDPTTSSGPANKPLVVVGASAVDISVKLHADEYSLDGSTHQAEIRRTCGGVARNIADALTRLGHTETQLMTSFGRDQMARDVREACSHIDLSPSAVCDDMNTCCFVVTVDPNGLVKCVAGDTRINEKISPEHINRHEHLLQSARLVVTDADTPYSSLRQVSGLCQRHGIPLWFEPTDASLAHMVSAIVDTSQPNQPCSNHLLLTSPNAKEIESMYTALFPGERLPGDDMDRDRNRLRACLYMSRRLMTRFHCVIVTLQKHGILVTRHGSVKDDLSLSPCPGPESGICSIHYSVIEMKSSVSECGAGDCFNAGFISALLAGHSQLACVKYGHLAALRSLATSYTVPKSLQPYQKLYGHQSMPAHTIEESPCTLNQRTLNESIYDEVDAITAQVLLE